MFPFILKSQAVVFPQQTRTILSRSPSYALDSRRTSISTPVYVVVVRACQLLFETQWQKNESAMHLIRERIEAIQQHSS